ncbi:UDP-2,3-diacylglucosamine diphosphatase [Francisellaceae bacterium]|nr:UDP-2,3-diacylglucosamine diphosphatase [Francisellaceae bacterium]
MKLYSAMPDNTYIISDLHLSEDRPKVFELFRNFIVYICEDKSCQALYILGDFFDYWIGDDNLTDFNIAVINELKALKAKNIKLYFMHGNRDFFIGKQFSKMSGATLLGDTEQLSFKDKRVILAHGDTLCTDDISYQRFRKFSRIKFFQNIYLAFPLSLRRKIALKLRSKSKNKGQRLVIQVDVTDKGVNEYKNNNTILIHGHTHKMAIHRDDKFVRAVLSDWHDKGSYILITKEVVTLNSWPMKECLEKISE